MDTITCFPRGVIESVEDIHTASKDYISLQSGHNTLKRQVTINVRMYIHTYTNRRYLHIYCHSRGFRDKIHTYIPPNVPTCTYIHNPYNFMYIHR